MQPKRGETFFHYKEGMICIILLACRISRVWSWFCSNHFLRSVNWCELGWNPSFTPLHKNISREVASFTEMLVKAICFGCIFAEENWPQKLWVTHFLYINFRNSPAENWDAKISQVWSRWQQLQSGLPQTCLTIDITFGALDFLSSLMWMDVMVWVLDYLQTHAQWHCKMHILLCNGCAGVTAVESITILHQCAKWSVWQALCQLDARYMLLVCSYICEIPSVLTCAFIVGLHINLCFTLCCTILSSAFVFRA